MSDTKKLTVKECVDFLDDQIERSSKFCKYNWVPFFTEIKRIVEDYESLKMFRAETLEKQKPPNDDLVEKFMDELNSICNLTGAGLYDTRRAFIRKLLQRQPEDVTIKITNMTDLEFCYREINRCKNGIKYSVPKAKKEWWKENLNHLRSIYKLLQGKK